MKNGIPSVVSGLRKRPPIKYIDTLLTSPVSSVSQHVLERPGKPTKFVTIADGTIKVFNEDGVEETVTIDGSSGSYLSSSDPQAEFGYLPIADTVYVYNKNTVIAKNTLTETRPNPENQISAVIEQHIEGNTFEFQVGINGSGVQRGTFTDVAGDYLRWGVNQIARSLRSNFNSDGTLGLTAYDIGNVIYIYGATGYDSYEAGPASVVRVYKEVINKFTNLPPYETNGRLVRISGDIEASEGDYWVRYNGNTRLWEETYGYNAGEELDATTMPHILVDNGDGTWTFREQTWGSREVGDDDSNPTPSFVGFTVNHMFMMSGRMCILSDENLVASEVGEYENFYRTTSTTLLDSDRIDVAALTTNSRTAKLYNAVSFDEQVMLFSDKAQFVIDNSNGLSPNTINLRQTASYNSSYSVSPAILGDNAVFVDDADGNVWADLREFLVNRVSGTKNTELITKQVPELVPAGVYHMAVNNSVGLLLAFSTGRTDRIYVHSSFWSNSERVQSAWAYWEDTNVEFVGGDFVGNTFYVTFIRDGKLELGYIPLQETVTGDFDGLDVLLDYRVDNPTITFDGDDSTITLPYNTLTGEEYAAVISADGILPAGTAIVPDTVSGTDITFEGIDLTSESVMVGRKYDFVYELSAIYLRDEGQVPVQDGRLQLRYLSFLYHQSSYFRVEVKAPGRDVNTSVFTGRIMGKITNVIGDVAVDSGEFRVPISARADEVVVTVINDSPFNSRFSSIEWEATWRPRTKRL